jgi:hypothetical protein
MANDLLRREMLALGIKGSTLAALATAGFPMAAAAAPPESGGAGSLQRMWDEFSAMVGELRKQVDAPGVPDRPIDKVEGYRLLTRYLSLGFERYLEFSDPAFPAFYHGSRDGVRKYAGDNPDELYDHAPVSPAYEYRITGNMHDTLLLECGVYAGDAFLSGSPPVRLVDSLIEEDLTVTPGGDFEIVLGGQERKKNWLKVAPAGHDVTIRRYVRDPRKDQPRPLRIERISGDAQLKVLTEDTLREGLITAARWTRDNVRIWADYVNRRREKKLNQLVGFEDTGALGTPAGHRYLEGYWSVPDKKALVITLRPPAAKYWNFLIMNYWMESLEWRFGNKVYYNNFTVKPDRKGTVTFVIAHERPRREDLNWLETLGHYEGIMAMRVARYHGEMPTAESKLVNLSAV